MKISDELLGKYNQPVPRYTSYPPANHFTDSFTEGDYIKLLEESNQGKPESIALYIHIPFCKKICHYCGCNTCSLGSGNMIAPYIDALKREIRLVSRHIDKSRPVTQLHYGGGTPNSLNADILKNLNEYLFSEFSFIENPEIAIECNPAYLDFRYIDDLITARFNRFSLGIQDFNDKILRQVNRDPSAIPPAELFSYLKSAGEDIKVNLDFIYGLPGQTVGSFIETITEAVKIRPDRLVTFSYAHVPWLKKHQLILEKAGLPAPEVKMQMFLEAYSLLKTSGYQPIGLDHFVLPDDDLSQALKEHKLHRNFQGYCTRRTTGQVYAFGVTAISQLEKGYSQNIRSLPDYISSTDDGVLPVERGCILTPEEMVTRTIITELMCNMKINYREIADLHNLSSDELKNIVCPEENVLQGFEDDGLIRYNSGEVELTETGSFFIRNIAASFDREFKQTVKTYSRTV
jgi:oxygen-independent coproporphyrinogen-3 oxidase